MSLDEREFAVVIGRLSDAYGSLSDPRFGFVLKAFESGVGKVHCDMLAAVGAVVEDTDINYDLSFFYSVQCGTTAFTVRISMIEPYAYIMSRADSIFLTNEDHESNGPGGKLVRLLAGAGAILLDRDDLIRTVPLKLDHHDEVNVFQALFFDADFFPWHKAR